MTAPTPERRRTQWEWLASASAEELVAMRVLRDGRCMDCGDPPAGEDDDGECRFCYSPEGVAFHAECVGLDPAAKRARRAAQLRRPAAPDPRQMNLL